MGFLSFDYFRCEPFELNFRLHVLGGFWPLETNSRWKKIAFSAFSFLSYFSLISMIAIQTAHLYVLRHDSVKLTRDLSLVLISFTITIKSVLILYKIESINGLRKKFTEFKNSRMNSEDVEILENSNSQILLIIRSLYGMSIPCVIFWILYPGLDNSSERRVPFPYLLPVEEWTTTVYISLYIYQSMAMVGFLINILSVDAMFCGFALRIIAHYDIIIKNLKALESKDFSEEDLSEKEIMKVIKDNVNLHQRVLRDIKTVENIYSPSSLVHFGGIVPIIGIAIIELVRRFLLKGFRLQILQKMLYVMVGLWDTFLYCFFATKIQEKSIHLSMAAYSVPWYNIKPRVRRDLLFISFKSQKTPNIKIANFFFLNLKAFLKILRISYDITALLFQTMKKK